MKLCIALILVAVSYTNAHVFLSSPIARTSIQLRPEFGASQPFWWDNQGVWCSNIQQNTAFSQCGRCGEAPGNRDASQGGQFDKGIIVATYTAGSIVEMTATYQAAHYGGFQIELCASETETDGCFQVLPMVSSAQRIQDGNRLCVPYDNRPGGLYDISVRVQLPANVRCNRCTVRFTHRTFYPWSQEWVANNCFTANPTQTFRNCADVRIV